MIYKQQLEGVLRAIVVKVVNVEFCVYHTLSFC